MNIKDHIIQIAIILFIAIFLILIGKQCGYITNKVSKTSDTTIVINKHYDTNIYHNSVINIVKPSSTTIIHDSTGRIKQLCDSIRYYKQQVKDSNLDLTANISTIGALDKFSVDYKLLRPSVTKTITITNTTVIKDATKGVYAGIFGMYKNPNPDVGVRLGLIIKGTMIDGSITIGKIYMIGFNKVITLKKK